MQFLQIQIKQEELGVGFNMDTGLGFTQPMFFIGVVENRLDPRQEGRVQVRAFGVHGSNQDIPTEDLPWATLVLGHHDVNFTPPPLNAWVFGFFIDGRDAQQPMILGLIPAQRLEAINPEQTGWGAVPAENYDRESLGSRPQDIGLSPMGRLATGEFTDETYVTGLATSRETNIPIAGGVARNYTPGGNSFQDRGFGDEEGSPSGRSPAAPLGRTIQERVNALDNDLEFQQVLERIIRDNNVSREDVYAIIRGESAFNPSTISPGGGYGGLFQMGRGTLYGRSAWGSDLNSTQIAALSPAEQARLYEGVLAQHRARGWSGGGAGLPLVQAAPAVLSRNIDPNGDLGLTFSRYGVGQIYWRANPGWRTAGNGVITPNSIAEYYYARNAVPPAAEGTLAAQRRTGDAQVSPTDITPGEERRLGEQQTANQQRIEEIRTRISQIDSELARIGTEADVNTRRRELEAEKAALIEELRILGADYPLTPANPDIPEPYRGYMDYAPEDRTTWDEPEPAYNAQYPYNRVIETASGHAIEIDDTPGAERIMIYHQSGSYVQLSTTSVTHKTTTDSYNIHDRNHHVYVGGTNIMTIEGDYHLLVKGNYVEEVQGDYQQIVHGNSRLGAGRRLELNGADRADLRGAALSLFSDLDNLNISTGGAISFQSNESISLSAETVRIAATENMSVSSRNSLSLNGKSGVHIVSEGNVHINPDQNIFLRADGGDIGMQSGTSISMNAGSFMAVRSDVLDLRSNAAMVLDSGSSLDLNSTASMSLNASAGMFMKGTQLHMKSDGAANIEGSELNFLSSGEAKLTGTTVYIDDIVQLASGASATPATNREPITAAPYGDSLDDVPPAEPNAGEIIDDNTGQGISGPAAEAERRTAAPPTPSLRIPTQEPSLDS